MGRVFHRADLLRKHAEVERNYYEFLRVPAISGGMYVLPAGATDYQSPHDQDEIYYVMAGAGNIRLGTEEWQVEEGDVVFVEAGLPHKFFAIKKELVLLVIFAPAETA